ncbi:MAG: HYR domain-containing protein [Bacteroidota bacterium]
MKKICTYLSKKRQQLLAVVFVLFSLTGFAQTNYYVAPTGNNANNGLSPATAKLTIQHTVGIAVDGDIIHLANGTYTLTATLNFNHELTIIGESEAGVIINATTTPASAWALNPNKSNTSLSNFTLLPNSSGGGFPIHVSANTGNPLPVISNISLSHITINGAKKTAFDFNAVNNLSLSYITATNTTAGNGLQLSGCWNVNASNITTSGNAWGGLAVYVSKPYPAGVGRGSNNISIDGTTSTFAEIQGVYNQDESGFTSTNTIVSGYDYTVQNTTAVGYTYYFNNKAIAFAFAAALPNPGTSSVKQISSGQFLVGAGMSIQAAVNAAAVNAVVNIEAGTYHEDVTVNKQITLQGAGMNSTIVSGVVGGGSATFQLSANGVVIDGFTITRDGNTAATWNDALNTAGVAIQSVGNADIRNCKFIGNRTAIDINNSNGNKIHNNVITDNRSGLLFRNKTDQTTVTENFITDNWTVGVLFLDASGGTNVPVQSAANSVFSNNDISGNWYGQIADRQTGGALPAAGNNLKNFSCNWYGSITPVTTVNNTTEPGYAAQVPVAYGGSAVAPGGQPDIAGSGSVNFIYQPYLNNGSDNDPSKTGFQPAPNSCQSPVSNAQVAATTNVLCHGGSSGSVTISFDNGIGALSYSLDGSASVGIVGSPLVINGLAAGSHTVIITDAAANTVSQTVTISQPSAALTANFTFTPIVCNGGMSTQNVTITGGTAPYDLFNQGGGAFVIGATEGVTYGGNEGNTYAANYVYTVTDANGCQYVFEANITEPAALVVSSTATAITCGGSSVVTVIATGGKAPYTGTGSFTVAAGTYTYIVTDANGCSSTTTITPDVVADTEKPSVTAPGKYGMVNDPGQCGRTILSIGTPIVSDNCGIANITNDHPSNYYPVGTTIVRWIVTDLSGNVNDTATQKITVIDNELPVIHVTNTSVNNTSGVCGANITLALPATSDNCGVASVTSDHPSTFFPVGTTNVTWKVRDNAGWERTAVQTVTVTDTEKPIVLLQPVTIYLDAAGVATLTASQLNAGSTDNCGIASYGLSRASFSCSDIGANNVTVTVTDINGNTNSAATVVTVKDNLSPVITPVANQSFCGNSSVYTVPVLTTTDNCSAVTVLYTITGATTRTGNTNNASGVFNTGVSTINWIAKDASNNVSTGTTTVTVAGLPSVTISAGNADAFCNKLTLTANASVGGVTYKWTSGSSTFAATQQVSLGQSNGDGIYQVTVTAGGCTSAAASYKYQKQNLISSYTILAFDDINLGTSNIVASGSVGVTSNGGEASFGSNSSVSSPGAFVKAKHIDKNGPNILITNPIYSAATGISLPTMLLNTANTNNLPNKDVAQNSVSTVNGNYKNLTLKKGSRTTLTGNTFGTIRVEQGAQVTFTSTTINIDKLQVVKGPRYGYSYLRFAPDTKILVSTSVSIGSQVYINPDNYKVTFYMGDKKSDEEKFAVNGGDTKVTANIYVPNGKLKVTGGYRYGDYGNGFGDCDRDDDDDRYYGQGSSYVNMTGLFIAEEVEGNGKNVIWNSFDCNAAPVPVLNTVITQLAVASKETSTVSEEELKVTVLPNPSTTYFTLKIESKYATPVNLRVIDSRGRVVDARANIGSNSTIQVGHGYAGGTYYAEMVQGGVRKVVQLIKLR